MVIQDNLVELLEQFGALFRVQFVDILWEVPDPEEALPSMEVFSKELLE